MSSLLSQQAAKPALDFAAAPETAAPPPRKPKGRGRNIHAVPIAPGDTLRDDGLLNPQQFYFQK